MTSTTPTVDRRTALRGAAAAAGVAAVAGAIAAPARASDAARGARQQLTRIRERLQLVDAQCRQRFLLASSKPPVYVQGRTLPASMRGGPDDGSYIIFNDENQNEKGGVIASSQIAQISLDYPTSQGLTMNCLNQDKVGIASITMSQAPDPSIPVEQLRAEDIPRRVELTCTNNELGCGLILSDSKGRPRIVLLVDGDDVPRIQILDADGKVATQLPADAPSAPVTPPTAPAPVPMAR